MARGLYSRAALSAWNWRDGTLSPLWIADSKQGVAIANQGAHSMMVADADGDGSQEIMWGSATISGDQLLKFCTRPTCTLGSWM